ncbi:MAG TPA: carbohydrate-binding protein [Accumulibacter sp.]|nr:carbohydrate-binding protein [Accumulibacter sp.]HMW16445.1 carbohydrate-binding protein [Accumulibacter sp.]HMX21408.1 carbohydrate-binding protein [Accumulibacter sp.]HMY07454.1 carbohydrate-binding protein [Accumulibacter sp.]HNC16675.1 carbohydrate-binding protein [Accumulibacter sp.]
MRKRLITPPPLSPTPTDSVGWLDLEQLVDVEISSEDPDWPIEAALSAGEGGWRAGTAGEQQIRLCFSSPQVLRRIRLRFIETLSARTQEFLLRWSPDAGESYLDIVRQQWNFSPEGSTVELEDLRVDLTGVTVLELRLIPDIANPQAIASLAEWRLA